MALGLALGAGSARGRTVELPLRVPDAFLRRLLVEQVFTEPDATARVVSVADPCNQIELTEPRVAHADGRIVVSAHARAQAGLSWLGRCVRPFGWEGELDAEEELRPLAGAPVVLFRVVDSTLRGGGGGWLDVPSLWEWVKPLVHPRLETLRVDLGPLLGELRSALPPFTPDPTAPAVRRLAESLALADARVDERGLVLTLRFEVEGAPPAAAPSAPEPPLTREQLRAFEEKLREWDAFLTFVVRVGGNAAVERELRMQLLATLLDAREELVAALDDPSANANERVRALFRSTWARLAPAFADLAGGSEGYRYLAFVASGDALAALDAAAPIFGFEITADGLRRLARTLAPAARRDPLEWSDAVDPDLRETFGFDSELPPLPDEAPGAEGAPEAAGPPGPTPEPAPTPEPPPAAEPAAEPAPAPTPPAEPTPPTPPEVPPPPEAPPEPAPPDAPGPPSSSLLRLAERIAALFVAAPASAAAPAPGGAAPTTSPLDGFAPTRAELDAYLPQVAELLRESSTRVFAGGRLEPERRDFFRDLVLSVAWQESCWRQYVARRGRLETLRSNAGALGLMQVNPRVWRGFFDVHGLSRSIRYNAHAGSEILLHYLRDYALARGEEAFGGAEALAQASYAAYNGGPSHLRRPREPRRWPADLVAIDRAFLEKYRAITSGRTLGVRECFSG